MFLEETKRVSSDTCLSGNIPREVPKEMVEKGLSGDTLQSTRHMKCEYALTPSLETRHVEFDMPFRTFLYCGTKYFTFFESFK